MMVSDRLSGRVARVGDEVALAKFAQLLGVDMANRLVTSIPRLREPEVDDFVVMLLPNGSTRAVVSFYDEANDRTILAGPFSRREIQHAHHAMTRKVTADLN